MQEWQFKNGKVGYSEQLKTEILGISQWIQRGTPLDDDQLKLIQAMCDALYQNNKIQIVKKKGRETGSSLPNLSLYVYEVVLKVDNESAPVGEAIASIAYKRPVSFKNLQTAYYKQGAKIRENLNDPNKGKAFRRNMNYALAVYLK